MTGSASVALISRIFVSRIFVTFNTCCFRDSMLCADDRWKCSTAPANKVSLDANRSNVRSDSRYTGLTAVAVRTSLPAGGSITMLAVAV